MMCENSTSPGTQRTLVHCHHNLSYFSDFAIFLFTTKKKQCTLHRYIFIKSSSLGTKKRLKFDIFTYLGDIFCLIYPKNTGHLEWNAQGDFSEFKTNGDSKEAL